MSIQEAETREGQRIAKVMARAGLCSRRDAERWIAEGRVVVNGETLTSPAYNVSEADDVLVDGQPLRAAERTRLFFFHKPKGLVTTAHDPEGRPTIFDALPEDLPRVVTVGRLDINTEGLLLLTNDGGLARVLELPATGWLRRYRVRAHGEITQEQLDALRDGVTIDGIDYRGIEAKFERQQGSNVWLTMGLREGKNREIKRVLEHLGMSVNRLIRVSFGPFELGDLPEGQVEEVRSRVLRDQLGVKLAKQAGVDFEGQTETLVAQPLEAEERTRHPGDASQGPPRKRKHVSVLRTEAGKDGAGPRKRVTRTATADRKGREVQVERVSLARPAAAEPPRRAPAARGAPGDRPRRGAGEGRSIVGARAGGDRPERRPARTEGDRPERRSEGTRGARAVGERPERRPRGDGPPKPSRFGGEGRAARPASDRAERRPRSEGPPRERTARSEGGATRAPRNYAEKRGFGSRPTGDRPERRPRSEGPPRERTARTEGGETRALRNYAEKRSFGSRPTGDRPERRPRSEGPPRERTARSEGAETRAPRNYAEKRSFGSRPTGDRAERRPRGDGPPRERRAEGGESRAPRSGFGEKRSFGDRPDRRPRNDGPPRERTARAEGGASREGRAFAPRASGGKPERRPRSDGPPRTGGKGPPRGPRTPGGKGGVAPASARLMRVVGGRLRGRALNAPASRDIRPTSDRLRESLFDVLTHRYPEKLDGARVVDLFAGSGALGIEAISRGAAFALLVDNGAEARALLRGNVETLGLGGQTRIWRADATKLGHAPAGPPFDLAFLDPPYHQGLAMPALAALAAGGWLSPTALAVVEEHAKAEIAAPEGLALIDERVYGDTKLAFYASGNLDPGG